MPPTFIVTLDGVSQTYSTSSIGSINVVGNGGKTTTRSSPETWGQGKSASFRRGGGQILAANWLINISGSPVVWVYGNSASTAQLSGSIGTPNTFVGGHRSATCTVTGYSSFAVGFGTAYSYAANAQDVAFFYSVHDGVMAMSPNYTYLISGNETFADNYGTVQA